MTSVYDFYGLFYELENLPEATGKKCEDIERRIADERHQTDKAKQRILKKVDVEKQENTAAVRARFDSIYQAQKVLENSARVYGAIRKNEMAPSGKPLSFAPAKQTLKALKKDHEDKKSLDLELRNLQKKFEQEELREKQRTADLITAMAVIIPIVIGIFPHSPLVNLFSYLIPVLGKFWAWLSLLLAPIFALLLSPFVAAIIYFLPHGFVRRRWAMKNGADAKRPVGQSIMWYILITFGYILFMGTVISNLAS